MASEEVKRPLAEYRLVGDSGLRVSPICLGTMNFGEAKGWTDWTGVVTKEETYKIFDYYISNGGNFIDCANKYQEGNSELLLGEYMKDRGNRDELVITTKYSLPMKDGSVNMAGNHRKNMMHSIDVSLKRLQTSYVDIFYVHYWDFTVSVEELMRSLNDIVRSGKAHYLGISDAPAWVVAQANTLAKVHGWNPFHVYQGRWHLADRAMERDVVPMCRAFNIGMVPWGVLGQGKLTGKYIRGQTEVQDSARHVYNKMSDKDYDISEEVVRVATEVNRTPAQVALNWMLQQPSVPSALVGVRKLSHIQDNVGALDFELSKDHMETLNRVSEIDLGFPHNFIGTDYHNSPWLKPAGKIQ